MPYPKLPPFNTAVFDPSTLTPVELCNELKKHYDHLMTAVTAQGFDWDSIEYHYHSNQSVNYVDFKMGSILIRKRYYYASGRLSHKMVYIKGVPPKPNDLQFVFGKTYQYNSSGFVNKIIKRGQ